jgi:hypothetical protein
MYIKDGFVYGSNNDMQLKVVSIKTLPDMMMIVGFSTGERRLFDATELKGEAFFPLREMAVFQHPVIDHGVVTWKNGEVDVSPEYLYDHGWAYDDGGAMVTTSKKSFVN